jgi:predicted nucleic acid-binding protein
VNSRGGSTQHPRERSVPPRQSHDYERHYPNFRWIAPDLSIADLAAQLRASYQLRTPDSLQAATALRWRAVGFITNDAVFGRVSGFETLLFDKLLQK